MVERGYIFIQGFGRVDAHNFNLLLVFAHADKGVAVGGNDLGLAGEGVALFPGSLFSDPVDRDDEDPVLERPCKHGLLAIGQDQVGRVQDDLGALKGQDLAASGKSQSKQTIIPMVIPW